MDSDDAVALLKAAVPREPGVWADLGAGTGTFTRALASLLPGGRVYAVDQNARSLSKLNNHGQRGAATIIPVVVRRDPVRRYRVKAFLRLLISPWNIR